MKDIIVPKISGVKKIEHNVNYTYPSNMISSSITTVKADTETLDFSVLKEQTIGGALGLQFGLPSLQIFLNHNGLAHFYELISLCNFNSDFLYVRKFELTSENIINNVTQNKFVIIKSDTSELYYLTKTNSGKIIFYDSQQNKSYEIVDSNLKQYNIFSDNFYSNTFIESPAQRMSLEEFDDFINSKNIDSSYVVMDKENLIHANDIEDSTYYQYNYNKYPYTSNNGNYTIATSGCLPTSSAIIVSTLTGEEVTPVETADWYLENGYRRDGEGTDLNGIKLFMESYGLTSEQISPTEEAIYQTLEEGKMIIVNVGPGTFTNGGHFMVIAGIADNGELILCDPNSEYYSSQTWDAQVFIDERQRFDGYTSFYACYKEETI